MDVVVNLTSRIAATSLAAALAVCAGCQLTKPAQTGDPFAAARPPKPLERAVSQTATGNVANPVTPVSFEKQQSAGTNLPAPGVSLGQQPAEKSKSWWERTSEGMKPKNIQNSVLTAMGRGPDQNIAKQKYAEGNQLFLDKKYDEAAKAYKEAARRWPDSIMEEDATFMLGESQFFADRYSNATDTYASLLKKYENSRYLDKVMQRQYVIGRYWDDQGKVVYNYVPNVTDKTRPLFDTAGHSINVYESIRLNDSTGPLADDAVMATANAYFVKGRYEDAAYHYDLLRKDYPKSEHQRQSHLLGLQSRMRTYQGPQYDIKPLNDAEKLADATINQFGHELPEERARLLEMQTRIRTQQAEREFTNGEYYYNRKYYGAARHHYQLVIDNFPESAVAQMARKRIEDSRDLPAVPPNYFEWMGKLFGERDRSKAVY